MIATVLAAGAAAGFVHVLAGADHLAAVAPLAVSGRRPWRMGARWGVGHAAGVLVVGLAAVLLRDALPIERLSGWSEHLVGAVLVGIGLWGIRRALRLRVHVHEHAHDGEEHVHVHVHDARREHGRLRAHDHVHASLAVGVLHGLAGSAHFLGVLPALALPSTGAAVAWIVAFGLGTIAAMIGFAAAAGWLAGRLVHRGQGAYRALLGTLSGATVAVGLVWIASGVWT